MSSDHPFSASTRRAAIVALLAAFSLSGCAEARRALGYDKAPPDEFTVMARAPLSQPPDFRLRPPTPGVARPQEGTPRDQAKGTLLAGKGTDSGSKFAERSPGERILLSKAGADKTEPDVRRKLNEETTRLIEADQSFTNKILFWQDSVPPGDVIDAAAEAKRLKAKNGPDAKAPVPEAAPEITRRKKGLLEDLF